MRSVLFSGSFGLLALLFSTSSVVVASEARPLRAEPFSALAIHPELSAPAQVVSLNDSRIEASIAANVVRWQVRVGDVVEAGAELLSLECGDQRDALAQGMAGRDGLKARLALAEFQFARARSLEQGKSISDEQLRQRKADAEALQAQLAGAEAGVAQALRNVERCHVRAPFKAVVMERLIGVGEKAQPGKPLLRLIDLSALEVSAQVPASDAAGLEQAEGLRLQVNGLDYPVTLRSVVPALDPRSRSRELRLDLAAAAPSPGSSGRLLWRQPQPHLPAEYLLRRDGGYGVFVISDGKARFVTVEGAREGSPVAPGLSPDTLVVTEGRYTLNDGDSVNRVE